MDKLQFDLFSASMAAAEPASPSLGARVVVTELDDDALIAAIPVSGIDDAVAMMNEAGRRKLASAIPVLEGMCRRFVGFGATRIIREQEAALNALAAIGGPAARATVARIITRMEVQGPNLGIAVSAAARVRAKLPADSLPSLLRHDDACIRADACRCARPDSETIPVLRDLLNDLHPSVQLAAALALGSMGRDEARPALMRLLEQEPSVEVIEAIGSVLNPDAIVLLARQARLRPDLSGAILEILDDAESPLAAKAAKALRLEHRQHHRP